MKFKKTVALIIIMALAIMTSQMSVFALSDVDFTLNIDPDITQYIAGEEVKVPIIIKTQTENGYVDMQLKLTFDKDALNLNTSLTAENDKGFTTQLTDDGVIIYYTSPDGRPSPIDSYILNLSFSVITGAGGGDYKFELIVERCQGLDENGSKEDITVSDAKSKTITIVETTSGDENTGSDIDVYTGTPTVTQPVIQSDNPSGGGCTAGGVIGIIFGAIVMFAAGVVVGYILCQRRAAQNEYDDYDDRDDEDRDMGFSGRFSRGSTRQSQRRSFDGGFSDRSDDDDIYSDLVTRGGARKVSLMDDDEIDTSYFGRSNGAGSFDDDDDDDDSPIIGFDDDDDDDGFPDEFKPRNYSDGDDDDDFGSFGVLGNRRRGRDDDGYGSFGGDDDDDDVDYRADRRRYR